MADQREISTLLAHLFSGMACIGCVSLWKVYGFLKAVRSMRFPHQGPHN